MYVIYFILLFIIILTLFISNKKIEKYDNITYIKTLTGCGRNIVFPYYNNLRKTISSRALVNNDIKSKILGNCYFSDDNIDNDNLSLINEDFINYYFKKICWTSAIKRYNFNNNDVYITFDTENSINKENMINFLLLNPLFVEFIFPTNISVTYLINPIQEGSMSFDSYMKELTLKFVPVTNSCDTFIFNTNKNKIDKNYFNNKSIIQFWIYYTEKIKNETNVFDKSDFNKNEIIYFDGQYRTNFMNTIYKFYNNNATPPITIKYNILLKDIINNRNKVLISKMYIDNGYYVSGPDNCGNNIFSIIFDPLSKLLYILTGTRDDCGYKTGISLKITTALSIDLSFTIGGNQKNVYVSWNDEKLNTQFIYVKKWNCITNFNSKCDENVYNNDDDFNKIFTNPDKNAYPLSTIKLTNSSYVKNVNLIELGY